VQIAPSVPADLLRPEPGWMGVSPHSEGDLVNALIAEKRGRERANGKLEAINEILSGPTGRPQ
jgi:hypothetical protein